MPFEAPPSTTVVFYLDATDPMGEVKRADDLWSSPGLSTQKLHLILGHLYLLPWFTRQCFCHELPLRPFLDANPDLELGGLPVASKLSRYGTEPPYLPSLRVGPDTDRAAIDAFAERHGTPLVLKPLFGSRSRGVRKVHTTDPVVAAAGQEAMILQPYVEAPQEYGINVARVGDRITIYGLTEITLRSVWGDGERTLAALARATYGEDGAEGLERGEWTPPDGCRVPLQTAADVGGGSSFRDITDQVTPALRAACQDAADQIGLRFGRFDVKAESLEALQNGSFYVLEANGSPSLDLTLYDDRHSLSIKIERLRAHWEQFFQQARPCCSSAPNTWWLLSSLLWFAIDPERCAASLCDEVDHRELASGAEAERRAPGG